MTKDNYEHKTSDDHDGGNDDDDEPLTTIPTAHNTETSNATSEEEKELSLEGFGSASITSASINEESEEEDYNAYYRDQIISDANKSYTPHHTVIYVNSGNGGNGKRTSETMKVTSEDIKFVLDTMKKEAHMTLYQ